MVNFNKLLTIRSYDKDTEVDWDIDYGVYGLNLSTMQFENTSFLGKGSKVYLNLFNKTDDFSEDIAEKAKEVNADYLLYTSDHWVVGYVIWKRGEPTEEEINQLAELRAKLMAD